MMMMMMSGGPCCVAVFVRSIITIKNHCFTTCVTGTASTMPVSPHGAQLPAAFSHLLGCVWIILSLSVKCVCDALRMRRLVTADFRLSSACVCLLLSLLHIFRHGQRTALNRTHQNVGFGSKWDPYEDYIVPPHLLVVHVELFATCSVWGEFTWPQNALVSSLESAFISPCGSLQTDLRSRACLSPAQILLEKDQMLD